MYPQFICGTLVALLNIMNDEEIAGQLLGKVEIIFCFLGQKFNSLTHVPCLSD